MAPGEGGKASRRRGRKNNRNYKGGAKEVLTLAKKSKNTTPSRPWHLPRTGQDQFKSRGNRIRRESPKKLMSIARGEKQGHHLDRPGIIMQAFLLAKGKGI